MTTTPRGTTEVDALTPRQEQVIRLIANGLTNPEIATQLDLTIDGVKWHVRELMSKLAAESRDEAVATWAAQRRSTRTRKISRFAALAVGLAAAVAAMLFKSRQSSSSADHYRPRRRPLGYIYSNNDQVPHRELWNPTSLRETVTIACPSVMSFALM